MNWLITGGCGFIGRNLIKRLVASNGDENIRVLDNFSVGTPRDLKYTGQPYAEVSKRDLQWTNSHIEVVHGDIMDPELAVQVASNADVIVHLAANTGVGPSVEDPRADCMNNVIGTLNYLEACRANGTKRFIFASSGAPVGECSPPIHEELACHPVSPYGASKLAGEAYCSAYARSFGVDTVALRFGNVYGPGSTHKSSVVAKFIRRGLEGLTLEVYGDGSQTRDFIYIDDLVEAIVRASQIQGIGGEIFQIATNRETTVGELAQVLTDTLAKAGVPDLELKYTEPRIGDVQRNYSDTSKARSILGWESRYAISDGLGKTVDWFIKKSVELPEVNVERES